MDYFVKIGPNRKIEKVNILAGKLVLQILLTQMCRSGEVAQLQLSTMRLLQEAVQFQLMKPTNTYSVQNAGAVKKLQLMTIKEFEVNPLLCPLTTLLAYIDRTKYRRGKVDNLFVLVTTQQPRAASWETIVRWAKEIMKLAGLGSSGTDVSPACEPAPKITITKPAPVKIQSSSRFSYDSAIAKLKAASTETPPGVPIIHGDVHESTHLVQRNYSGGIKYLLTGDEGAKKLVMSKKCKYEPNVTSFVGESIGFIKGFNEKSQPSKKFQNINLVSLGAALRKADQTENINKVHCPRTPFSSAKFDSEITVKMLTMKAVRKLSPLIGTA